MQLTPKAVRIQNFRNIEDTGWIPLDRITALVGRNESGKTAILTALHKFNPASPAPYQPLLEFPREKFTHEFRNGSDWPVASVQFEPSGELKGQMALLLGGEQAPEFVTCVRYYDNSLSISYSPPIAVPPVSSQIVLEALKELAAAARRLPSTGEDEEAVAGYRQILTTLADVWTSKLGDVPDLRSSAGVALLQGLKQELNQAANPTTAASVEATLTAVDLTMVEAAKPDPLVQLDDLVGRSLPVFIYFENYGILDSSIYLPRLIEDKNRAPNDPKVRTILAMFKHVGLSAEDIAAGAKEEAQRLVHQNQPVTEAAITKDKENKEERAIKLNSASIDLTQSFSAWWHQRRHSIRYHADGDYFRIWVSDDRRPNVEIELEARSKGFQWFFSFYLVFLVESDEMHKEAILLLDEPGLHLHATGQQELIGFFEELSGRNPIIYSTHSPFMIDADHVERVRPVTEEPDGHTRVRVGEWPEDRDTIFPLQAAAGYAMVRGLFQHRKNLLVEGLSDYYYLASLSGLCQRAGRLGLPDDIYITPCGGTKHVGQLASLFLGQQVRPLVLLDGDDAGRARANSLTAALYTGHEPGVLLLSDVLGLDECEIEDVVGDDTVVAALAGIMAKKVKLQPKDAPGKSLPDRVAAAAARLGVTLPEGWRPEVARRLVSSWASIDTSEVPIELIDQAEKLFVAIRERFEKLQGSLPV